MGLKINPKQNKKKKKKKKRGKKFIPQIHSTKKIFKKDFLFFTFFYFSFLKIFFAE